MSVGVLIDESIKIPPDIDSLEKFRQWTRSPDFPEKGRIDYIRGVIEVELMPERMSHGEVKVEIARVVANRVRQGRLGKVLVDSTRVSSPTTNLSCEPDVLVLLRKSIDRGEVTFIPSADNTNDPIEIVGGPDLVVEIISPHSVSKDTYRLPSAYFEAGVREYWLVDARREELQFQIFRRGEGEFVNADVDEEGFQISGVLERSYRLTRQRESFEEWWFDLEERMIGTVP